MPDSEENRQPRLSEFCPICKELMIFHPDVGHLCCQGDVSLLYNPESGDAFDKTDFEALWILSGSKMGNEVHLHLRDAGIEADLISLIKKHLENDESRTRITKLFSAIKWPPYDHDYTE